MLQICSIFGIEGFVFYIFYIYMFMALLQNLKNDGLNHLNMEAWLNLQSNPRTIVKPVFGLSMNWSRP